MSRLRGSVYGLDRSRVDVTTFYAGQPHGRCVQLTIGDAWAHLPSDGVEELIGLLRGTLTDDSVQGNEMAQFYEKAQWQVGERVRHVVSGKRGQLVKRGGTVWANRSNLPLVRWDGQIETEPIAWEDLETVSPRGA